MFTPISSQTSLKSYLIKSQAYLSLLILLVCVIGMTGIAAHTFKKYSEDNLQLIAQLLSEQLQAAIIFDDKETIHETLKMCIGKYPLESIQVTHVNGQLISYINDATKHTFYAPILEKIQRWLISDEAGHTNITHNGQTIAKIKVVNSIYPLISFLQQFLILFTISLISALLLISFSTRLIYRKISYSLDTLTETTESVTAHRDFDQRVPSGHIAEFNIISQSFNALLNEIQTWHTHLQQENSHLEHRALHDTLTQLPNRAYFNQRLSQIFENQDRHQFALLYIDNNNFKEINDTHGHLYGDAVLREMAVRLKLALRPDDFLARIGGDEFAVLVLNINKPIYAITVAQNLLHVSDAPLLIENLAIRFSFSIGIALSSNAESVEDLIHQADQAMYQAKLNNIQKLSIYDQSTH
ncbi:sensor domain-containing diguanylate cyclase [Acinetobacter puyangensis]|uniref:Diguanylate cyclase (GGDEF) domain-containing protein n=1 Tax=Acinetobacter puyangensis TaxID=1096779 RepID=A0A240E4K8_9GAMM|nr:diguanylate cyclase [Acinetobacter puyangensis]SNX43461.1 diguanylate cyclase (GGDEF) domain-containing protein [Acinetobacter puyangensis]